MPRLWRESVQAHRAALRDAVLDATGAIVAADGLPAVSMSRIAQDAGIGRATLYKYFSDVQAVLDAWHQRQVHGHLALLTRAAGSTGTARERLGAVLDAYAGATRREHGNEPASLLHQGEHVVQAQQHLRQLLADLLARGAAGGEIRRDVPPDELAAFCLHALTAAGALPSDGAVRRLVAVTMAGLQPP